MNAHKWDGNLMFPFPSPFSLKPIFKKVSPLSVAQEPKDKAGGALSSLGAGKAPADRREEALLTF